MGIYPAIPGIGGFVIASPLFNSITLNLSDGQTLQINMLEEEDINPDPYAQSLRIYVQSLKINGYNSTSLWIPWSSIKSGATLDFILGNNPSTWGINPEDAPPSFSPL